MSTLSGLISAGGGGSLLNIWIRSSQTWTPPFDGVGTIHVIGGGAPGQTSHRQEYNICGGGPAGGYSRKEVTFSTSTNWTMTIGAGGVPTLKTTSNSAGLSGGVSAGGLSRAVASGYNILANGGGLGGATDAAGAAGGTASGGDVNYTGGKSGTHNSSFLKGKGGGAVATQVSGGSTYPALANRKGGQNSDCIGPYDPSSYGQMTGGGYGGPAIMQHYYTVPPDTGVYQIADGGFLAGGGAVRAYAGNGQDYMIILGGDGGIGGGGGFAQNTHSGGSMGTMGGHGGQGIIFIQYRAKE